MLANQFEKLFFLQNKKQKFVSFDTSAVLTPMHLLAFVGGDT